MKSKSAIGHPTAKMQMLRGGTQLILTSAIFLLLLLWNGYSSISLHRVYQVALMERVTDSLLSDYQRFFDHLRLQLKLFQQQHIK